MLSRSSTHELTDSVSVGFKETSNLNFMFGASEPHMKFRLPVYLNLKFPTVMHNCTEYVYICVLNHGLASLGNDRKKLGLLAGLQAGFLFQENEKNENT